MAHRMSRIRASSHFRYSRVAAQRRFVRAQLGFSAGSLCSSSFARLDCRASRRIRRGVCTAHAAGLPRMKILVQSPVCYHISHLTNRWSQPLAAVKSTFDFMKQFSVFATLAAASGGSALSR